MFESGETVKQNPSWWGPAVIVKVFGETMGNMWRLHKTSYGPGKKWFCDVFCHLGEARRGLSQSPGWRPGIHRGECEVTGLVLWPGGRWGWCGRWHPMAACHRPEHIGITRRQSTADADARHGATSCTRKAGCTRQIYRDR